MEGVHCPIEFIGHLPSPAVWLSICGIPDVQQQRHRVDNTELPNVNVDPGKYKDLLTAVWLHSRTGPKIQLWFLAQGLLYGTMSVLHGQYLSFFGGIDAAHINPWVASHANSTNMCLGQTPFSTLLGKLSHSFYIVCIPQVSWSVVLLFWNSIKLS